jgi:hypothetical protein
MKERCAQGPASVFTLLIKLAYADDHVEMIQWIESQVRIQVRIAQGEKLEQRGQSQ